MRIRLSDLAPGINYALQLRTNTGSGVSDWSRAFYLTTANDTVAPNVPANVVGSMTGSSFQLAWDKVTNSADGTAAHDLDRYEVKVESTGTATTGTFVVTDTKFLFDLAANRQLFSSPRANIKMSVRAVDKVGNASSYSSVVDQTNATPANPANFTGNGIPDAVVLKWDAVTDSDLSGYKVYSGTTAGTQSTLVWSGTATSATIRSTAYNTDTWYRVTAYDLFGTESSGTVAGAYRPTSPAATDGNAPDTPTGLAATLTTQSNGSHAAAAVSWTAVTDTDGDLAGYRIGYRPVGASDWQYTDVDYTNTSTLIDRLTPYVNYEFRIRAYDFSANYSGWSTTVTTTTAAVNAAPSTPAAPTVLSDTLRIQVSHDNTKAGGGAMEADVAFYEVYASSSSSGFTPSTTNMLGTMSVGPAIIGTFYLPATGGTTTQNWYVKVIAVDRLGLKSSASASTTGAPGLIANTNIIDATITNAKINDLAANKITAGTGFVNDITVKSKLTLGDASTTGTIETYDYATSGGTTGASFSKNGIIIKSGAVEAAALKIQDSQNLVPAQYASFEVNSATFTAASSSLTASVVTTNPRFGSQHLSTTWSAAASDPYVYMARNTTDYNIEVEAGQVYIVSAYMAVPGAVATTVRMNVKYNDGTTATVTTENPTTGSATWIRSSGTITVPAGVTKMLVWFDSPSRTANSGFNLDGIQVERKQAALNTPSPWTPPGLTNIDAGIIRTGEMRSTSNVEVGGVSQPAWSINTAGNIQLGDAIVRGKVVVGTGTESWANRAPGGGDFESNVTGYSVYHVGATGTAIARTTTGGEVISGTGSAKVTAAAGSKTSLGLSFSTPQAYTTGALRVRASVKANTTDASSNIYVDFVSSGTAVNTFTAVPSPVSGTVYAIDTSYTITAGQSIDSIRIYHGNTVTSTSVIVDSVVLISENELGASTVQSAGYSRGSAGWAIDGQGDVEFNSGVFRGELGAGIVTADTLASTIAVSTLFRAGEENGRRVQFSADGILAYKADGTPIVSIKTDDTPVSIDADLLASSLTVSNKMAIRGEDNELSKGAKLTLSAGTTAPTSPPTVVVDWETIPYSAPRGIIPYRFGITQQGGWWRTAVQNGSLGAVIESYDLTTGARQTGYLNIYANNGIYNPISGITAIGNNVYVLGTRQDGSWRIMGWTLGTEVSGTPTRFLDAAFFHYSDHRIPALGNDGTNLLEALTNTTSGVVQCRTYNATTGAQIGSAVASNLKLDSDMASIIRSTFDGAYGGVPVYVVTSQAHTWAYVLDSSFQRASKFDFPLMAKSSGQAFYNNTFYTFDNVGERLQKHTGITWDNSVLYNDRWHAANTWYNTDATNGSKETTIGSINAFTMKQRARVTITSPPIPERPVPNTVDDATAVGLYMARRVTFPSSAQMQRQLYLADGVRTAVLTSVTLPAQEANAPAASQPPSTNTFPTTTPSELRSGNDRFIVKGDGTGQWGDAYVDSSGILYHSYRMYTMVMEAGWAGYGSGFNTGMRAYRTADGIWYMAGMLRRTGTAISINNVGVHVGTLAGAGSSVLQLTGPLATGLLLGNSGYLVYEIKTNGEIYLRTTTTTAISFTQNAYVSGGMWHDATF